MVTLSGMGGLSPEPHGPTSCSDAVGYGQGDRTDRSEPARQLSDSDLQKIIDARRLRSRFFEENLFADPAWDILLDLYRAHLAQHRISVTSVCFGSDVPVSTAFRWLNALEERGLVERTNDPLDGRRFFVALTESGVSKMSAYFASAIGLPI